MFGFSVSQCTGKALGLAVVFLLFFLFFSQTTTTTEKTMIFARRYASCKKISILNKTVTFFMYIN